MRVLMLSIDDRVFEEGSEVRERIKAYGRIFDSLHVMVFTRRARVPERLGSVFLYPTPAHFTPLALLRAIALGRLILRSIGSGAVVTSQEAFTSVVAATLRYIFGAPLQVQVHTDFLAPAFRRESFKNYLRFLVYRWSVRRAEGVRVVSERIRRGLVAGLGVPQENVTVLPIFVDAAKLASASPDATPRQRYVGGRPLILMVSRLTREKNIGLALRVMAEAVSRLPEALLVIVGDGPERARLEAEARALGLVGRVRFEGWQPDVISYYRPADVLLVTSNYEGYGRMFVEAAAAGLPIVSTDVGIIGETFRNGESVLVFQSAAEGAWAIRRLTDDPALAERLAANARRAIGDLPDFPTYLAAYRRALERCSRWPASDPFDTTPTGGRVGGENRYGT